MARTVKSLLAQAARSLQAARRAGDADTACRHAFAAALAAAEAIGLVTDSDARADTLEKLLARMGRHELVPAARALDACALTGDKTAPGRLTWTPSGPRLDMRGGAFSKEHAAIAVFGAEQIFTRAQTLA